MNRQKLIIYLIFHTIMDNNYEGNVVKIAEDGVFGF